MMRKQVRTVFFGSNIVSFGRAPIGCAKGRARTYSWPRCEHRSRLARAMTTMQAAGRIADLHFAATGYWTKIAWRESGSEPNDGFVDDMHWSAFPLKAR